MKFGQFMLYYKRKNFIKNLHEKYGLYHRNESAGQKTLSLKSEETFVKENYMLSRERLTCFTQLCSDPKVDLKTEFVFKRRGTQTHLTPAEGANYQWVSKGSYRIEQILDMIK